MPLFLHSLARHCQVGPITVKTIPCSLLFLSRWSNPSHRSPPPSLSNLVGAGATDPVRGQRREGQRRSRRWWSHGSRRGWARAPAGGKPRRPASSPWPAVGAGRERRPARAPSSPPSLSLSLLIHSVSHPALFSSSTVTGNGTKATMAFAHGSPPLDPFAADVRVEPRPCQHGPANIDAPRCPISKAPC